MHKTVTLGFTTNLTVYPKKIIELLKQFTYLHVGLSIETLDKLNDFIRIIYYIATRSILTEIFQ